MISDAIKEIHEKLIATINPIRWKVQSMKYDKALIVPFIDARDVAKRLDEVVGPDKWCDEYYSLDVYWPSDDNTWEKKDETSDPGPKHSDIRKALYCKVGIKFGDEWVFKSDMGDPTDIEPHKGESSDAFKRSCVKWGIGRFLYYIDPIKLPKGKHTTGKPYPATLEGRLMFDPQTLSEYCNKLWDQGEADKTPYLSKQQSKGIVQSNLKDWREFKLHFGKKTTKEGKPYKGMTLGEIYQIDKKYMALLRDKYPKRIVEAQQKGKPLSPNDEQLLIAIQEYAKFRKEEKELEEIQKKIQEEQNKPPENSTIDNSEKKIEETTSIDDIDI